MSHRRAVYAARFLRPPSWTKRLLMREKPRTLTGPFENPMRRWVRLREKARQFSELPPPRKVPVPKPVRRKPLQAVEGVPKVAPEALERRLEFLLSEKAIEQQLAAPLRTGITPFMAEFYTWQRQMRDLRRVYRAQYLQKLAMVTEVERQREAELYQAELQERKRRKQAHLQRVGEDMKRRAILKDRKRVESKVTEAMEMARRSKVKRGRLFWLRRMDNLSKLMVTSENFEQAFPPPGGSDAAAAAALKTGAGVGGQAIASGVLISRNMSVPLLLRQLGGSKTLPQQRSRRIPHVENMQRDILESSYELLPEDAPRFPPAEAAGPSHRQRAKQLYSGFTSEEKLRLLDQKISMVQAKLESQEKLEKHEEKRILTRVLDELISARMAAKEGDVQAELKGKAMASRGEDPLGAPPRSR